jgi:transcription-repair coupling factor (superfamily II helicase)
MRIPPDYVPETHQRLSIYKRVSQLRREEEVAPLRAELRDRYGPLPPEVEGLLRYAALRVRAEALAVVQADATAAGLSLRFDVRTPLQPAALVRVVQAQRGASLMPDGLRWPMDGEEAMDALDGLLHRLRAAL